MSNSDVLKTYVPVAMKAPLFVEPAKRAASLDGKRVGLLWNGKPGGDVALNVLEEMLKKRFKDLTFWRSTWYSYPFTAGQHNEVIANCDVAIATTGD